MKALIIGAGSISELHCQVLESLGVEVASICDLNEKSATELAGKFNAKVYTDINEALNGDMDFAVVCTPSGTHPKLAIQVMRAGKNVVVEKPIALSPEDCDEMLKVQAETGVICAPISQLRFSPYYRTAKAAIEKGYLGKLIMSSLSMKFFRSREYYLNAWRGTKEMDGGELMNQGLHGIDVMCGLLGRPVNVCGKVTTIYHDIEAEDTAAAAFTFPCGMLGTLESSTALAQTKPRRFEILGVKGSITFADEKICACEGFTINEKEIEEYENLKTNTPASEIEQILHRLNYINILASFAGEKSLYYTLKDATDAVKLICAIYQSSETGKTVEIKGE